MVLFSLCCHGWIYGCIAIYLFSKNILIIMGQKYKLHWCGEVIDETNSFDKVKCLLIEYNLAYGGGVTVSNNGVTLMVSYD